MKRYVLIPGIVISQTDGQAHYVSAPALAYLYGVDMRDCEVYEPAPYWSESFYRIANERIKGLIRLTPRSDGNYSLSPTDPNSGETCATWKEVR